MKLIYTLVSWQIYFSFYIFLINSYITCHYLFNKLRTATCGVYLPSPSVSMWCYIQGEWSRRNEIMVDLWTRSVISCVLCLLIVLCCDFLLRYWTYRVVALKVYYCCTTRRCSGFIKLINATINFIRPVQHPYLSHDDNYILTIPGMCVCNFFYLILICGIFKRAGGDLYVYKSRFFFGREGVGVGGGGRRNRNTNLTMAYYEAI